MSDNNRVEVNGYIINNYVDGKVKDQFTLELGTSGKRLGVFLSDEGGAQTVFIPVEAIAMLREQLTVLENLAGDKESEESV